LSQLFAAIRKLTIMVHLLIINVQIPANASLFFTCLLNFVTFNIVNLEPYLRRAFRIDDSYDAVIYGGPNFHSIGYPSNYFAINIGNLLLGIAYLLLAYLLHFITLKVTNRRFVNLRNKLTGNLFWKDPIQFLTEAYMLLTISTFTNFFVIHLSTLGDIISGFMTFAAFFIVVGLPILVAYVLIKNQEKLATPDFMHKWGYLYESLNLKRHDGLVLLEPVLFYCRILVLSTVLLYLR
jgi:hypothetical protein